MKRGKEDQDMFTLYRNGKYRNEYFSLEAAINTAQFVLTQAREYTVIVIRDKAGVEVWQGDNSR